MAALHSDASGSPLKRFLRFGFLQGLRSVEIDPEDFRAYLARKHRLHVSDFRNMYHVPIERLGKSPIAALRARIDPQSPKYKYLSIIPN